MRLRRRITALVGALAVLVGAVVAAPAGAQDPGIPDLGPDTTLINERPNGKLIVETPIGRIYGNLPGEAPDGLFVITGDAIEKACTSTAPPLHRMVLVPQANGKWTVKTPAGGTQVFAYVYDTDLGGDDFFGAMCGGMFENGTPPLAPLAVGMVTLENRDRNIADITTALSGTGPFNASLNNSITGLVSDRDGNVFELDARFKGKLRATGAVSCTGDCSVTLTPHAG